MEPLSYSQNRFRNPTLFVFPRLAHEYVTMPSVVLPQQTCVWPSRVCTDLLLVVIIIVIVQPLASVQQHGARHHALADVVADLKVSCQQRLGIQVGLISGRDGSGTKIKSHQ